MGFFFISGEDQHYKPFEDVYDTDTTEEHKPSSITKTQTGHQIPFSPFAQTAKTVQMTVTCVDCDKPRVIYSATKLNASEKNILARMIQLYTYSCGAVLQDLKSLDNRPPRVNALLDKTFVRQNIACRSEIEVPYFSSKCFPNVCFH